MANINLLPWRAERRKQREREFYMMLLAAAVGALLVFFVAMMWVQHVIDDQQARNDYLKGEITALDAKIKEIEELDKTRADLITRKEIIEQLQSNRSTMVHLFDELVRTIPDGVRLTTMKQVGDTITLDGRAESNQRVASYLLNIDRSPWLGHSDLKKTENTAGAKDGDKKLPYQFSMDVKLRKPEEQQKAQGTVAVIEVPSAATGEKK
ncbi:MAG: fimbrial assembly protein [Xanthomonadales bacterium]|uniref:PilN domain-containing protein n=1 Tax=Thermomonas sp. TaxID=1971895 RepID=UPI001DC86CA4|nr:PilN domain-containing protein [Thermomonas sp.]MBC6942550.1 fimbrial assembly protein [Xanthomonadales bacterium]MDL1868047.1 PilN domain-containing protein [Gammaproteobacteria bacterium PRO6]